MAAWGLWTYGCSAILFDIIFRYEASPVMNITIIEVIAVCVSVASRGVCLFPFSLSLSLSLHAPPCLILTVIFSSLKINLNHSHRSHGPSQNKR